MSEYINHENETLTLRDMIDQLMNSEGEDESTLKFKSGTTKGELDHFNRLCRDGHHDLAVDMLRNITNIPINWDVASTIVSMIANASVTDNTVKYINNNDNQDIKVVKNLVNNGEKIKAIKHLRGLFNNTLGLKVSKDLVEAMVNTPASSPASPTPAASPVASFSFRDLTLYQLCGLEKCFDEAENLQDLQRRLIEFENTNTLS